MARMLPTLEGTMLKKQNRGEVNVLDEDEQIFTHHQAQFSVCGNVLSCDGGNAVEQELQGAFKNLKQNLLFGGDVMIQTRLLQIDCHGNIRHGCAMIAFLAKDLGGGFKDVFSGQRVLPTERSVVVL